MRKLAKVAGGARIDTVSLAVEFEPIPVLNWTTRSETASDAHNIEQLSL